MAEIDGCLDLQFNGYIGVDFNQDTLNADDFHRVFEALEADGVRGVLPTIITEQMDKMVARIERVVALRQQDPLAAKLIPGLHVEGPFLSDEPIFHGAHPVDALRTANTEDARRLIDAGDGLVKLLTLAPERDEGFRTTHWLADQGITVSAGHTDASLEILRGAIDAGLTMVTHVGNGCPGQLHRHDNIVQRALALSEHLWLCFIGDGVHIPFFALGNYLKLAGSRAIMVTDAMPAAGMGQGTFQIGRWTVEVDENMAAWAPGRAHLLGAVVTMAQTAANLSEQVGLSRERIRELLVTNPHRAIGIDGA